MATPDLRVSTVSNALTALGRICDSGFALAVHIRLIRPTLLYQTYAQAWVDHYSTKGYMLTDPTVVWGLEHTGAISWAALADRDSAGIFADARSFGLMHGHTYATGPANSRTIASAAKSAADFTAAEQDEICRLVDQIHAATEDFDHFAPAMQQALRDLGG